MLETLPKWAYSIAWESYGRRNYWLKQKHQIFGSSKFRIESSLRWPTQEQRNFTFPLLLTLEFALLRGHKIINLPNFWSSNQWEILVKSLPNALLFAYANRVHSTRRKVKMERVPGWDTFFPFRNRILNLAVVYLRYFRIIRATNIYIYICKGKQASTSLVASSSIIPVPKRPRFSILRINEEIISSTILVSLSFFVHFFFSRVSRRKRSDLNRMNSHIQLDFIKRMS